MDNVKTAEMPYLCGFSLFFCFRKNVIFDRFRPFESKKSGVKSGGVKLTRSPSYWTVVYAIIWAYGTIEKKGQKMKRR